MNMLKRATADMKKIPAISETQRNNAALLFEELEPFFKQTITTALVCSFPCPHGRTAELQAAYWLDVAAYFQRSGKILECCGPEMSRIADQHKRESKRFGSLAAKFLTREKAP